MQDTVSVCVCVCVCVCVYSGWKVTLHKHSLVFPLGAYLECVVEGWVGMEEGDPSQDEEGQYLHVVFSHCPLTDQHSCERALEFWQAAVVGGEGLDVAEDGTLHGGVTESVKETKEIGEVGAHHTFHTRPVLV